MVKGIMPDAVPMLESQTDLDADDFCVEIGIPPKEETGAGLLPHTITKSSLEGIPNDAMACSSNDATPTINTEVKSQELEFSDLKKRKPQEGKRTQQQIRIVLKKVETLSFNIIDKDKLKVLKGKCDELEVLARDLAPSTDGLILRPSLSSTLTARRAKLKFKSRFLSLTTIHCKRGRKRQDWRIRNRVGVKAAKLRKALLEDNSCSGPNGKDCGIDITEPSTSGVDNAISSTAATVQRVERAGKKRSWCKCSGCVQDDCGDCCNCKDMKRFGGPGKKKKRCKHRQCLNTGRTSHQKLPAVVMPGVQPAKKTEVSCTSLDQLEDSTVLNVEEELPPEKSIVITNMEDTPKATPNNEMVVLNEMNRLVKPIIGDGNCFYRSVAQIVYGDEMLHGKIRELLADFISRNRTHFQPYIDGDMVEYIARVRLTRVWGTAVELLAAASLFDIPVYTLVPYKDTYHWLCYKPLENAKLIYPKEPPPSRLHHIDHFELLNVHGCHYDVIASEDGGVYMLDRPLLSKTEDFLSLD
ncbi:uncharacterized protein [Dysidea avara]|uniref:uncharacterized protein n=1 Tax=Dysidea avara TaxID=196820 RepID=UPI0033211CDE